MLVADRPEAPVDLILGALIEGKPQPRMKRGVRPRWRVLGECLAVLAAFQDPGGESRGQQRRDRRVFRVRLKGRRDIRVLLQLGEAGVEMGEILHGDGTWRYGSRRVRLLRRRAAQMGQLAYLAVQQAGVDAVLDLDAQLPRGEITRLVKCPRVHGPRGVRGLEADLTEVGGETLLDDRPPQV